MRKGYRVRLYPNKTQERLMLRQIEASRYVYNYFLDKKKRVYLNSKKNLTYSKMSSNLTRLRRTTEWLRDLQLGPMQQALRQLDVAYNRFFRKQSRFPKFKHGSHKQSFRKVTGWSIDGNKIRISRHLIVRFRGTVPERKIGAVVITREPTGKWFASIMEEITVSNEKLDGSIGIDLGLKDLVITSDGEKYGKSGYLKGDLKALRNLSKKLSRTAKGSKRREKARLRLNSLHSKIANKRKNYLHHVSKSITDNNYKTIITEDLAVINMMKNRRLSRAIADSGWSELVRQITYKQEWKGGGVIKVDRFFPSSKTCSGCGFILEALMLGTREWTCPSCEVVHDRDINAAKNILKEGVGGQLRVEKK